MSVPDGLLKELKDLIKSPVLLEEPMRLHTSWRIGGPADILIEPEGMTELKAVLSFAKEKGLPLTVIGAGSNLLVSDKGIEGIVIKIASGFAQISVEGETLVAGGGVKLNRLTSIIREAGIGGFEFLAGIPGTVGGAVIMNAGAYGLSISDRVISVNCLDFHGREHSFDSQQMEWGYRSSFLQGKDFIVTGVVLKGNYRDKHLIAHDMEQIVSKRKSKQPLEYPSAGSVFKNPPGHYAGKLIQESQCQGLRVGDAQVSLKHANFIVNLGKATSADVLNLIEMVKGKVREKFGVGLEVEIRILGRN